MTPPGDVPRLHDAPLALEIGARGSVAAYACWLGCLAFRAYNYAICAFAFHFGLLLVWVVVLGLSF